MKPKFLWDYTLQNNWHPQIDAEWIRFTKAYNEQILNEVFFLRHSRSLQSR